MNYHEKVSRHLGVDIPYFPLDGKIHRFSSDKTTKKPLWAIGNEWIYKNNSYWSVTCGDFRNEYTKKKINSWDDNEHAPTKYFQDMARQKQSEIAAKIENEKRQIQETCRVKSTAKLKKAQKAEIHPYLTRKKIKPFQSKVDGNLLLIPAYDELGIVGHQNITADGKKWYSTGIKIKGAISPLKEIRNSEMIYVTEGFATAASIQMAINYPVVVCFSANNISNAIVTIGKINPDAFIVICADRDKVNEQTGKRTGEHYAMQAHSRFKNSIVIFPWDDVDRIGDFNDLHCEDGIDAVSERVFVDLNEMREKTRQRIIKTGFSSYDEKGRVIRDYEALLNFLISETNYFYVPELDQTYIFNGKYYEKAPPAFFKNFAQKYFSPFCDKSNQINEFTNLAIRSVNLKPKDLQADKKYIPFANGLLNFITNDFIPHTPRIKVFHVIPWDYQPDAKAPVFEQMMKNITCNRPQLIDQLLEFMGWTISGLNYNKHQKFLILAGHGKNGKSTFITMFNQLLGDDNCSAVELSTIANNRFAISSMENALLNVSEEEDKKCFEKTGMLKKLTGNSPIQSEKKFKDSYKTTNRSKIMISYNEVPYIHDLSKGMRRRMLIVPFDSDFDTEKDKMIPEIEDKLLKEMSGIINWCLYGLRRLNQNGDFTHTVENSEKINEMIKNSNSLIEWVEEELIVNTEEECFISTEKLFNHYKNFDEDSKLTKRIFAKKVLEILKEKSKKVETARKYEDAEKKRGILHVELKSNYSDDEPKGDLPF